MSSLTYTPMDVIPSIHAKVLATFRSGRCRPLEYRRKQLHALVRLCQENVDAIAEALYNDLKKPRLEALGFEVAGVVNQALTNAKNLEEWAKPEAVAAAEFYMPSKPTIYKTPKGPVLGIVPWNFPFYNVCFPLIAAISTGNTCVIKPSEISAYSAQLFADLLPRYLDPEAYIVVNGAIPEATKLLELKWAHIFYTGNSRVARIISTAAAKHLTPLTLELGGKSPVIIDPNFDIKLAAQRILFGKTTNAGQICVAPDYVLILKDKQDEFVQAIKEQLTAFYPNGQLNDPNYTSIISSTHFSRITNLLQNTRGTISINGRKDEETRQVEMTVVTDVRADDPLMGEELFGPILPVIPISSIDEAVEFINSHDHPLVLYAFTENGDLKQRLMEETVSGAIQFNDTIQYIPGLPFGGIGESGHGSHGYKHGFDDLSHKRAYIDAPREDNALQGIRYPPYSQQALEVISGAVFLPIPTS